MSSPGVIRKLDETLVNRIAAGEVVQRPVNALKELLENSLDAKSTDIIIRVQYGSMKFMQIQDNGTGIRKEDLDIVCERFTTSKLSQFEDLNKISTFGFRGEALASISHVAHLSIVTKTADEQCAYIARYRDGKLIKAPTPTAGNQGTQITVEDLFYNVPARRQALKNTSDEYYRILDMVGSYAIHNPKVGFAVKKQGDPIAVLRTPSSLTHVDNIKEIHGMKVSRELLEIDHSDTGLRFSLHGYITNVNYSTKKQTFLLFINNRLVDSTSLRKALDSVYSLYLPKGSHPFMYLSLSLDPRIVDVNVHPTKHEVHFLHEDSIIEKVRQVVDSRLSGANSSRVFRTQIKPAGSNDVLKTSSSSSSDNPSHMVRTDSSAQKIDKFFTSTPSEVSPSSQPSNEASVQYGTYKIRNVKLTSVLSLREEIEEDCSPILREIFANLVFVGCVDKTRALIQCKEELYLCNTEKMLWLVTYQSYEIALVKKLSGAMNPLEELFYQIVLYTFGGIGELVLENGLPLIALMNTALECPRVCDITDNKEKDKLAFSSVELLKSKGPMIYDYFSMKIDDDGNLLTVPYLLNDYLPDMGGLPLYIYGLATAVNWDNEKECFRTFSRETAKFYSRVATKCKEGNEDWQWVTEHVVYRTVRESFRPPKHFGEDFLVQLTSIPELYKVFERC